MLRINRVTTSIVSRSKRTNVIEYPSQALRKIKKKNNYITIADLVEPLYIIELLSKDQNIVRCLYLQCNRHCLRQVKVIRDYILLVYILGTIVINTL